MLDVENSSNSSRISIYDFKKFPNTTLLLAKAVAVTFFKCTVSCTQAQIFQSSLLNCVLLMCLLRESELKRVNPSEQTAPLGGAQPVSTETAG